MHSVLQLGSRAAPSHTRDGACGGRRGHPGNRGVPAHWAWAWPLVLLQQGFAGLRQQQASPASEMWRGIQGEFGWGHSGGDTPRRIRKWPNPWPEPSMHTTPRLWQGLAALQAPSPAPQPPGPTPCERLHLHEATWTPSQRCPGPGSLGLASPTASLLALVPGSGCSGSGPSPLPGRSCLAIGRVDVRASQWWHPSRRRHLGSRHCSASRCPGAAHRPGLQQLLCDKMPPWG